MSVSIDSADSTDEETLGDEDNDDNAGDVDMSDEEEEDVFNVNDGDDFNWDDEDTSRNHGWERILSRDILWCGRTERHCLMRSLASALNLTWLWKISFPELISLSVV